jgi:hypothetical protein
MEFNWKCIGWLAIGVFICFAILSLVCSVDAAEDGTVIEEYIQYPFVEPYRLPAQGATVYVNDTVDISGQGWADELSWYGKYGEYEYPQYILTTPYQKTLLRNYYIDPVIFESRPGMWYQYYGNASERNGNLASFFVKQGHRNITDLGNGTLTIEQPNPTLKPITFEEILPEVPVTGYLVAIGDELNTGVERGWLFGRTDYRYARDGYFAKEDVESLAIGSYKIIAQNAGNNTIYDVGYNSGKNEIWRIKYDGNSGASTEIVSVAGVQPMVAMDLFKGAVSRSDDKIETYNMEVQEPEISIVSIDEVDVGNRIPIAWEPGMTLLDVRGYSNVANGTELSFIIDPDKQTARTLKANTYTVNASRTSIGNMSWYRIYIPINKNTMPNGMHTLYATTAIGGSMRSDFPISELPADSFVPNATLKYIGDSNPWKPNLTIPDPIVVEKIKVVEKVIEKPVPPSNETVLEQQRIAVGENVTRIGIGIVCVIGAILLLIISVWIYRTHRKTMDEKEWFRRQN